MNTKSIAVSPRQCGKTAAQARLYIRTSEKPQLRLSGQNDLIASTFDRCNFALIELIRRNIDITRVVIGGSRPVITIMDGKAARALPEQSIHRESDNGFVRVAHIKDCVVTWETKDDER